MGEKIIIQDTAADQEAEVELEQQYISPVEFIQAACLAMDAVDDIDTELVSNIDKRRIKRIKRQSMRIISESLNMLYEELFDPDGDEPAD